MRRGLLTAAATALLACTAAIADDDLTMVKNAIAGTWSTQGSTQGGDDALMMSISPVEIEGIEHAMYVEGVRAGSPWDPFRQAVFSLFEYKDKVRLRTYELAMGDTAKGVFDGMGAATGHFPDLTGDDLIATLDVELDINGTGFSGSTPYPYPTGAGGAVEMTSSITFDGTTLTTADRGYDADGEIVWGASADAVYEFERVDPYAVAREGEQGLVVIEYPATVSAVLPEDGGTMAVHYYGYTADGTLFDTSHSRGEPFEFPYPPGTRAITGWGLSMVGFSEGAHRKAVIPSAIGYGERGNPRAGIPGGATLYFNIEAVEVTPAPEQTGAEDQAQPDQGAID